MPLVNSYFYEQTAKFNINKSTSDIIMDAVIYGLESFERVFALLFFLTLSRFVFALFIPIIFILSTVALYYMKVLNFKITSHLMPVVFEATPNEFATFISTELIVWCVLSLCLAIFFVWVFIRHDKKDKNKRRNNILLFFCGAFFLSFLLLAEDRKNDKYMPYNYIKGTVNYFTVKYYRVGKNYISIYPSSYEKEDVTVLVVLGDSARSDRFSLNGYERNTNPNMSNINNLVSFKSVKACDTLTMDSIPCIMTRAKESLRRSKYRETSFISVFRKLGFDTVWIDGQGVSIAFAGGDMADIMLESEEVIPFLKESIDTNVLPMFDDLLEESAGNKLIIYHSNGSHWHYDDRYKKDRQEWNPTCRNSEKKEDSDSVKCESRFVKNSCEMVFEMAKCDNQALTNSYDNSILETDYFLSELINKIKDRNSILFYTSDHGESLGEEGFYLHGHNKLSDYRPEQYIVPMIIWASDIFLENNPSLIQNIEEKVEEELTHEVFFHTVMDCVGVESEVVDKKLSLCTSTKNKQ
jgi:glucan phosphoethanolaminetransferase (alkaline phosphatase superfamily)